MNRRGSTRGRTTYILSHGDKSRSVRVTRIFLRIFFPFNGSNSRHTRRTLIVARIRHLGEGLVASLRITSFRPTKLHARNLTSGWKERKKKHRRFSFSQDSGKTYSLAKRHNQDIIFLQRWRKCCKKIFVLLKYFRDMRRE